MPRLNLTTSLTSMLFLVFLPSAWGQKPPLTLDEFFNAVDIRSVQISPDGHGVVIETVRPDWAAQRFRNDLWLYRDDSGGSLVQFTQSGHDRAPQWSPDGRWIAFLSDRKRAAGESRVSDAADRAQVEKDVAQVFVISSSGGEPVSVTFGDEELHTFAWSADSHAIYFATRDPWTQEQKDTYKREWNDVIQFRESERGDTIFSVEVVSTLAQSTAGARQLAAPPGPKRLAAMPYRVEQMATSPDGNSLAFTTNSPSERGETPEPNRIYVIDLQKGAARLVLHTLGHPSWAGAGGIRWSPDNRNIFFVYAYGIPEGPYEIPQTRLYQVAASGGEAVRWASGFMGDLDSYAVTWDGSIIVAARLGTEVGAYVAPSAGANLSHRPGWAGTYDQFSAAPHSSRVAFVFSSLQQPTEVYLAEGPEKLEQAHAITALNKLFTERELPRGKVYRWTADDGTPIESMLIYPPGNFEAKHLPMFTLIHGGPDEADGNHFEADWYQWAALAATQGWLVFEPNYSGSDGYGDAFALSIVPHILSRPGKEILEGVDALVKDGIADPARLTVGGYSYGGYLTNWLITQTTRFKAAVTGAGAVEHVATWGNDNSSFYDAYQLGGVPWTAESNYNAEAAIWQIGKVTTPTHIVAGAEDINVPVSEDYLLERALHTRGIPHRLLIFPGEGHGLDKNPWHGKMKVREELKWLEKYGKKSP